MLNRINDLSRETLRGSSPPAVQLGVASLETVVGAEETAQHILASTSEVEVESADGETTIGSNGEHAAYAVVSDRRLHFVRGDRPGIPQHSLELAAVERSAVYDGLLTTVLTVETPEETVRFEPTSAERATAASAYVERTGRYWTEFEETLDSARTAIEELEAAIEDDRGVARLKQRARSRLSKAYHVATRADDAPTALMRAQIAPVEAELEVRCTPPDLDEVASLVDDARYAHEASDYDRAYEALVEAHEAVSGTRHLPDDPAVREDLDAVYQRVTKLATAFLGHAEDICHNALAAEAPADTVAAWDEAFERYRSALTAGWDEIGGVTADALRFQLSWVVRNLIDALEAEAEALEAEGDDRRRASDHYRTALDRLERAKRLATEHPYADGEAFDDRIRRLEEKVERAQWRWGTAD